MDLIPRRTSLKVLVVEDNLQVAQVLREALEGDGLSCDLAFSAQEADTCLEQRDYKVLVVDNQMPGREGMAWIRESADRHDKVAERTVFITSYIPEEYHSWLREVKIPVLTKPFDLGELCRVVRERGATR